MNTPKKAKNEKTKIVIIDDHPIVRRGIALTIEQEEDMLVAGEADDAASAMTLIEKVKPDLVLVDISLRGTSGIELTKDILAKHPQISVLIISMHDEALYLERALRAGAKGYLTKQEAAEHIVTAIHKVLRGDIYMSNKWKDKLVHKFVNGGTAKDSSPRILSDRELDVLQLIGQGYSTQRIAAELYVSVKTIESHYANIKDKLDLKNSHELIQYAVKWSLTEK
jgi:DNA-binding NarL/FixJ family response regulator